MIDRQFLATDPVTARAGVQPTRKGVTIKRPWVPRVGAGQAAPPEPWPSDPYGLQAFPHLTSPTGAPPPAPVSVPMGSGYSPFAVNPGYSNLAPLDFPQGGGGRGGGGGFGGPSEPPKFAMPWEPGMPSAEESATPGALRPPPAGSPMPTRAWAAPERGGPLASGPAGSPAAAPPRPRYPTQWARSRPSPPNVNPGAVSPAGGGGGPVSGPSTSVSPATASAAVRQTPGLQQNFQRERDLAAKWYDYQFGTKLGNFDAIMAADPGAAEYLRSAMGMAKAGKLDWLERGEPPPWDRRAGMSRTAGQTRGGPAWEPQGTAGGPFGALPPGGTMR